MRKSRAEQIFSWGATIASLISLMLLFARGGHGQEMTVMVKAPEKVNLGDMVRITIDLSRVANLGGLFFDLTYEGGSLSLEGVDAGGNLASQGLFATNPEVFPSNSGRLRFGFLHARGLNADGTLVTVLFRVNRPSAVPPSLLVIENPAAIDTQAANLMVKKADGAMIILVVTDLSLVMADNPDPVPVGDQVTYTLTVKNNGPSDATGVRLTNRLPDGVTFVSATSTQGTLRREDGNVISEVGNMAKDATATVRIVVATTAVGTITNTATVTGNEMDPNNANNAATQTTAVISRDVTPPSFTITLSRQIIKAGQVVTMTITASESLLEIPNVSVTQAGRIPEELSLEYVSGLTWKTTYRAVSGYDGTATVNVSARDSAKNLGTGSCTFIVDSVPPAVTMDSPTSDRIMTKEEKVFVAGRTEPGISVKLNDEDLVVSTTGEFSTYVSLAEGENPIRIVAVDGAGNETTITRVVIRDTTAPFIRIRSPQDGALINQKQVDVSGITEVEAYVTVNEGPASVGADGSFTASIPLIEGENMIEIISVDKAGNRGEERIRVISDTTIAKPKISAWAERYLIGALEGQIDLSGERSFPVTVTVYLQPERAGRRAVGEATFSEPGLGIFKVDKISLEKGKNVLIASVQDGAGNISESDPQEVIGIVPLGCIVAARTTPSARVPTDGFVWHKDQEVVMKVQAENLIDITGSSFTLKYDPSFLRVADLVGGARFDEPIYEDDGKGTLKISINGKGRGITGKATIVAMTFLIVSEKVGRTEIRFESAKVTDAYGNEIPMDTKDGTIRFIKLLSDLNQDGRVDIRDLMILKKYYMKVPGAELPDGTKVPPDLVKEGMKIDDDPSGDNLWDFHELIVLVVQWGWDWRVRRLADPGSLDEQGRFLSSAFIRGIELKPERSVIALGESVRTDLRVDGAGISAGEVVIEYDPSKLQFIGSVGGDDIPFVRISLPKSEIRNSKSEIVIDFAPIGGSVGRVASLTFKGIGAGNGRLKVSGARIYDSFMNEITGPVPSEEDIAVGNPNLAASENQEATRLEVGNLYPNPADEYVIVPILSPKESSATIALAAVSGHLVRSQTLKLRAGINQPIFDLSGIASGTYRVIVRVEEQTFIRNLFVK